LSPAAPVGVVIAGAAGRMGRMLVSLARANPALRVVGALEAAGHPGLGADAGRTAGGGDLGVPIAAEMPEAPAGTVLIDFTAPGPTLDHVRAAADLGWGAVVGTTGFTREEEHAIDSLGDRIPLLRAANMSVGVTVLLDVARLHGVDCLPADHGIGPDELDAACTRQGVEVGAGDIVLLRTGWTRVFRDRSAAEFMRSEPGLTVDCCRWLHERDVAAVAADNWGVEVYPSGDPDARMPVHYVLIRDMGMTLGEMFDLEALAEDCAADGVYEVLLCAPVLKVAYAVGTPLNPLAVK